MTAVVRSMQRFNAGREPERLAMKYQLMRRDAFVFLRGTCHLFYERLPRTGVLKRAPLTWVCGDLHLQNFGSYKGDNRLTYFDINDFDEAALAPCTWDLVRLLTSLLVGAQALHVAPAQAMSLARTLLDAYASALELGKARWIERDTAEGLVRALLDSLRSRSRKAFLDQRTVRKGKKRQLRIDAKHTLPLSGKKRERIAEFMNAFAHTQPNPAFYRVLDIARRVAGTASLGLERHIILIEGKGSPHGNYLLDVKEARGSSLVPYLKTKALRVATPAHRVVAIQRRMQAVSMAFLHPVTVGKTAYVMRGLQPSDDRVALEGWHGKLPRLERVVADMGRIVAWAQLRSGGRDGSATIDELIAFAQQAKWRKRLLEIARHCAAQVEADWHEYAQAYDDGAFDDVTR
jgi:uncharacterized protein (DUF2252 family)